MGLGTESHCHNKDLALSLQQLGGTPVPSPALCVAWRSERKQGAGTPGRGPWQLRSFR